MLFNDDARALAETLYVDCLYSYGLQQIIDLFATDLQLQSFIITLKFLQLLGLEWAVIYLLSIFKVAE
jgi:hypothetical protein